MFGPTNALHVDRREAKQVRGTPRVSIPSMSLILSLPCTYVILPEVPKL
jgi:hypothetical protein